MEIVKKELKQVVLIKAKIFQDTVTKKLPD